MMLTAQQAPIADIEAVMEAVGTLLEHTGILPIGIAAPLASFHSDLTVMIEDYRGLVPGDDDDQGDDEKAASSDTPDQVATPAHE